EGFRQFGEVGSTHDPERVEPEGDREAAEIGHGELSQVRIDSVFAKHLHLRTIPAVVDHGDNQRQTEAPHRLEFGQREQETPVTDHANDGLTRSARRNADRGRQRQSNRSEPEARKKLTWAERTHYLSRE